MALSTGDKVLLSAVYFWAGQSMTMTLRAGARNVARAGGLSPVEADKIERKLVKDGYLARGSTGSYGTIGLTPKGLAAVPAFYDDIELLPWRVRLKSGKVVNYAEAEKHPETPYFAKHEGLKLILGGKK